MHFPFVVYIYIFIYIFIYLFMPVPVAASSKAWVCGGSPAEIVGSNPTGSMDVSLLWVLFVVRGLCDKLITRPEESYRMWCVVVCDLEILVNEKALAHWGLSRQKKIHVCVLLSINSIHVLSEWWLKSVTATANNNVGPESKYLNARRNEDYPHSSADQSQLTRQ